MIIKTKYTEPDYNSFSDIERYTLSVNDQKKISVGYMEPEDASLSRDLSFVFDIIDLMKQAYEAGKRGEDFIVIDD